MNDPSAPLYVVSLEEILWGVMLVAVTMIMHGFGMIMTLQMTNASKVWLERSQSFTLGVGVIILASWMIILVHLSEVLVWAAFFLWKGAMPNASVSYYFSLNEYTTVGSDYNLPQRWHLLEGMIATAGLLGFAWSTGILLTLAQEFQDRQMQVIQQRRDRRRLQQPPSTSHPPRDSD